MCCARPPPPTGDAAPFTAMCQALEPTWAGADQATRMLSLFTRSVSGTASGTTVYARPGPVFAG
jgi:hypothetical protein